MKSVKNRFILLFIALSFWGCERFLDKYPHDELSDGTFWTTENEIAMGLTACYSGLYSGYISAVTMTGGNKAYWDGLTDNAFFTQYWGVTDMTTGSLNPSTPGLATEYYSTCFELISRINIFLSKIGLAGLDEGIKTLYMAEARFLRAFAYHELVLNYGGVPLFESAASVEDASKGRNSKEEIMDFIHEDLDYAIENLPDLVFTGHAVKNSARALKARVLLYSGDWSGAAQQAEAVISSGKTSLYPDYRSMFLDEGQGEDNTEILFSVKFLAPNLYHSMDYQLGSETKFNVLEDLVNDYLTINGLSISEDPQFDPDALWENRDPRLQQSIFCKEGEPWVYDQTNGYIYYAEGRPTKFAIKKYLDTNVYAGYDTRSEQDVIHLRLADVLLMYSEAKNELGQFGINEWNQTMRLIRARAGFTVANALNFPGGSQGELREIIRHERRIELAFEGTRYYDLLRWGTIKEEWENIEGENPQVKTYDETKPLWPIPQTQIDYYEANGITFGQNPGY